jgi:putative membrane protein
MWRIESLLWSFVANALALWVAIIVFSGVTIGGVSDLFKAAVVFGLLNTFLKPLVKLVTLPLAVITLRLIWFFVAMLMLEITTWIVGSFDIHGFLTLIWATLLIWGVNLVLDLAPGPWRGTRRDHHALSRGRR